MAKGRTAAQKGKRSSQKASANADPALYCAAKSIALEFLQDLSVDAMAQGSEIARDVYNAVRNLDYATLVNLSVDPSVYRDAASFQRDYQLVSLLRKSAFLETGIDRQGQAVKKWCAAETRCGDFNDWITDQVYGAEPDVEFLSFLNRMRGFIARLLGPAPRLADLDFRFGPGATQLVKRGITLPKKYSKRICCTPSLVDHVHSIIGPHWGPNELFVVDGNSLSFVPKDARTDRSICIEPDLNIYVQLGIGRWLRKKCRRYFDLDTQADRNREVVARALGRYATIDLSSASDTISSSLVFQILPEDWYDLLDMARCRYTLIEGRSYENQKFSSMGNGFTFELETLIFYAVCRVEGIAAEDTCVFGDDIIVPQSDAQRVISRLEQLGFSVNKEKTFLSGSFFESCGHDYFNGTFVRPFFWKDLADPVDVIKMCNDVSRLARVEVGPCRYFRSAHVYRKAFEALVRLLKIYGWYTEIPDGIGDVGVITDFDDATPKRDSPGYLTCMVVRWRSTTMDYSRKTNGYLASLDSNAVQDIKVLEAKPIREAVGPYCSLEHRTATTDTPVRGEGKWEIAPAQIPLWSWVGFGPWID